MSKIMSILEKCNLVEKVNNENLEEDNLNEENKIEIIEDCESNALKVETNDYKQEIKAPEPVIKEKSSSMNQDLEYEKKMMVDEIYSLHGIENSNINTVFMLQNFINALPQNLPKDVVKQSVINIIAASNIDLNQLLTDGEKRLEVLDNVMVGYSNQTNKCIHEYKEEIDKLSRLINNCQEQIKVKESMLEDQTCLIKYESQKIKDIIEFFLK